MSCCEPHGTGPDSAGFSLSNVGGGVEIYRAATGPNPFELRTIVNGTGTTVVQNATTIQIDVTFPTASTCANVGTGSDVYVAASANPFNFRRLSALNTTMVVTQAGNDIVFSCPITAANEGGFAQILDTATSTAILKNLRTIQSSDASVTVVQNATNIDLRVPVVAAAKTYFSEVTASVGTNGIVYVVVATMGAVTGALSGETWIFVASELVCCVQGLTTVNQIIRWEVETSAGVWGIIESAISHQWGLTLAPGDVSTPSCRTYQVVLGMNAPRLRVLTRMSAAVATGGIVENPKVSGYKR